MFFFSQAEMDAWHLYVPVSGNPLGFGPQHFLPWQHQYFVSTDRRRVGEERDVDLEGNALFRLWEIFGRDAQIIQLDYVERHVSWLARGSTHNSPVVRDPCQSLARIFDFPFACIVMQQRRMYLRPSRNRLPNISGPRLPGNVNASAHRRELGGVVLIRWDTPQFSVR